MKPIFYKLNVFLTSVKKYIRETWNSHILNKDSFPLKL